MSALPGHGQDPSVVLTELRERRRGDLPTHGGRTLAYVYDSGLSEIDDLAAAAHATASSANGLDPTAFPSLAAWRTTWWPLRPDCSAGRPQRSVR
jgi:sphinganine-1-phosphate aldolase